jgi:dolichyl-phosphate-mannose--protein O-mannosyl transferase
MSENISSVRHRAIAKTELEPADGIDDKNSEEIKDKGDVQDGAVRPFSTLPSSSPITTVDSDEALMKIAEPYLPWILLAVALATRFYRLDVPRGVVFDEYHFGRFVNQYNAGTYLFDIHPPLGKLVFYYVGKAFGYDHTKCQYNNIQDQYKPDCKFMVMRVTAALFGSATAPLMYAITRNFGGSAWVGILASIFFIFDNLNLTESRLILVDSQLIFWCALSLFVAQRWWERLNAHDAATESWLGSFGSSVDDIGAEQERGKKEKDGCPNEIFHDGELVVVPSYMRAKAGRDLQTMMNSTERNLWCLAVGFTTSCALSTKWTTLATPGMIAVESFFAFFFLKRNAAPFPDLLKILAVASSLYYLWFAIHFSLLPYTGDGDAFMRVEFQRTLVNNTNYDPLAPHPGYFTTFLQLNAEMLSANARIDQRHHWESVWWEWPLNLRGILYYSQTIDSGPMSGMTKTVYLLGNPAVIWIVLVFIVSAFLFSFVFLRYREHREMQLRRMFGGIFTSIGYCLWTYMLNLLPYILVNRSAFIYHYMPALMYAEVIAALMVEQLAGPLGTPRAVKFLTLIVLVGFVFWAPWVYCYPLTSEGHARRRLLKRWD